MCSHVVIVVGDTVLVMPVRLSTGMTFLVPVTVSTELCWLYLVAVD